MATNNANNTTNYATIVDAAKEIMKKTSADRKIWNTSYYSLSRLLRDTQMKTALAITTPIFESLGLPTDGKIKPSSILDSLQPEQFVIETSKKGEQTTYVVLWSRVQKTEKDAKGNITKVFEADGTTPVMVDKYTKISDGKWTLNAFVRLIGQRNAFKAQKTAK